MKDKVEITVGQKNAKLTGNTNVVIQSAVDMVAKLGGGVVKILKGTYEMADSLHLRTGVTVRGCGEDTVLRKAPSTMSVVDGYMGYGHYDVSVMEPGKFKTGMGVYIADNKARGFYGTVATVNRIEGNILGLTNMLNSDIHQSDNGKVISVYPVISGYHLKNACIENLLIDGNKACNDYLNGCRGGGIFLLQAHDVCINGVIVKNYNGDGISFQQSVNTRIEKCKCIDNNGHGLHPGSGSIKSVMREIVSSRNGMDGIFYCLRVSYTLCENCELSENKRDGISIGHRDFDSIIRKNSIINNFRNGIYIRKDPLGRSAHRNLIEGNIFSGNCKQEGTGVICIDSAVSKLYITDNEFDPESKAAVEVNCMPSDLVLYNNIALDENLVITKEEGFKKGIIHEKTEEKLNAGPEQAPYNACLHLGDNR